MSQLTQNLGLEIFDVENLDDQKKVKDYLKGVAGISGSNMIKIDEAFGNISSSNVYPRYTALVNELDNKFYLYKDDWVTAVTNFASLPEKFVLQIQCTSTKAFNGESIFTVNDSFDPVIKNKDSFLRDDFGWPVFEKGSDKSFLVEKYIDNTGAEPDNFVFIAALADANFESRAIKYYDAQDKLGLGIDANVNEAILKLNDKIEILKTNVPLEKYGIMENSEQIETSPGVFETINYYMLMTLSEEPVADITTLPDEMQLIVSNIDFKERSSYPKIKIGTDYYDFGTFIEGYYLAIGFFESRSRYLLNIRKMVIGESTGFEIVNFAPIQLHTNAIDTNSSDNLTERLVEITNNFYDDLSLTEERITTVLQASGTANNLIVSNNILNDRTLLSILVSYDNSGLPTTINSIPLYKPGTTSAPNLKAGRVITVWYNEVGNCFFYKASAEGDAVATNVLAGKTFSNDDDTGLVGTMVNRDGAWHSPVSINNLGGTDLYVVPKEGYYSGNPDWQANGGIVLNDPDFTTANIKAGANIFGLTGTFTSDANAVAENILSGKTAYVNGNLVTGTMPSKGAQTFTPGTSNQTISLGRYLSGNQTILGDPDLIGSNIRAGVNIFGVNGWITPMSYVWGEDNGDLTSNINFIEPGTYLVRIRVFNSNDATIGFSYTTITVGQSGEISEEMPLIKSASSVYNGSTITYSSPWYATVYSGSVPAGSYIDAIAIKMP